MNILLNIKALPAWVGHIILWTEAIALIIGLLTISILLTSVIVYGTIYVYRLLFCYYIIIKEKVGKVKNNKKGENKQ